MISFKLHGGAEWYNAAKKYVPVAGMRAMKVAVDEVKNYIISFKLQGHPLYSRSGGLAKSIIGVVKPNIVHDGVVGVVGTPIRWARVHELGAIITPKTQPYLKFRLIERGTGKDLGWRTVKQVLIPQRAFLKPAVKEKRDRIKYLLFHNFTLELRREIMREMRGARFGWGAYVG